MICTQSYRFRSASGNPSRRCRGGHLGFRKDTGDRLKAVLTAEPVFVLAHCLRGYFMMLFGQRAMVSRAQRSLEAARSYQRSASPLKGSCNNSISAFRSRTRPTETSAIPRDQQRGGSAHRNLAASPGFSLQSKRIGPARMEQAHEQH